MWFKSLEAILERSVMGLSKAQCTLVYVLSDKQSCSISSADVRLTLFQVDINEIGWWEGGRKDSEWEQMLCLQRLSMTFFLFTCCDFPLKSAVFVLLMLHGFKMLALPQCASNGWIINMVFWGLLSAIEFHITLLNYQNIKDLQKSVCQANVVKNILSISKQDA